MTAATLETIREHAACRGQDPAAFFPEAGGSANQARRICRTCPVQVDCLTYALGVPVSHDWGVWGGTTEDERQQLRRCTDGRCEHPEHHKGAAA
jgi:hypothetical protein